MGSNGLWLTQYFLSVFNPMKIQFHFASAIENAVQCVIILRISDSQFSGPSLYEIGDLTQLVQWQGKERKGKNISI